MTHAKEYALIKDMDDEESNNRSERTESTQVNTEGPRSLWLRQSPGKSDENVNVEASTPNTVESTTVIQETDSDKARDRFSSQFAYLMSAIGFAVGLGNIWRFPAKAYKYGGGAFLVPYFCCTFFFAVPLFYLETAVAQYVQKGPMVLFYKYMPASQGIGWSMIFLSFQVYTYYMVIVGWTLVYLVYIIIGKSHTWTRCDNDWNSIMCFSRQNNMECVDKDPDLSIYFNGTCHATDPRLLLNGTETKIAAEEFFINQVLQRTEGIHDFGGINWPVFGTMAFLWILCGIIVWRGLAIMGKVSFLTTSLPYVIVGILFIRGITLDGARQGLDYYLLNPNFSKVFELETWKAAIFQVCFSISIGLGVTHSMGSFTRRSHNTYRDAYVIVVMDAVMSVFGGTAVFSILGYLSAQTGTPIEKLIESDFSIAFIAYPEAMALMPLPVLWAFLFFLMLFVIGLSTQLVDAQAFSQCVADMVPMLRPHMPRVRWAVCIIFFFVGILTYTKAGIYWLTLLDGSLASIGLFLGIFLELVLFGYVYGCKNIMEDLRVLFGKPTTMLGKIMGNSGYYFYVQWTIIGPVLSALLTYESFEPLEMSLGDYIFPPWTIVFGYIYGNLSLIFLPAFLIINMLKAKQEYGDYRPAFQVHPTHPSYHRIMGNAPQSPAPSDTPQEGTPQDTAPGAVQPATGTATGSGDGTESPSAGVTQ